MALNKKVKSVFLSQLQQKIQKNLGNAFDIDQIWGTIGEFGLDVNNPVPVEPIVGTPEYLNSLTFPDGTKVVYKYIALTDSAYFEKPIKAYGLSHKNGKPVCMIFFSTDYARNSRKMPDFQNLIHRYTAESNADVSITDTSET